MAKIVDHDGVEILDGEEVEAAIVDGTYDDPDMWNNGERLPERHIDDEDDPEDKAAIKAAYGYAARDPDRWQMFIAPRSQERVERMNEEAVSKLADAAIESLVKQGDWTGPHEGPQGGVFWEHNVTGERRYQEHKPDPVDADEEAPEIDPEAEDVEGVGLATTSEDLPGEDRWHDVSQADLARYVGDGEGLHPDAAASIIGEDPHFYRDWDGHGFNETDLRFAISTLAREIASIERFEELLESGEAAEMVREWYGNRMFVSESDLDDIPVDVANEILAQLRYEIAELTLTEPEVWLDQMEPEELFEMRYDELGDGMFAEVARFDVDDSAHLPMPGREELVIGGQMFETDGWSAITGPGGETYWPVKVGGRSMTIPVDRIDGIVTDSFDVGDYEVGTEIEARVADGVNRFDSPSEWAANIGARDIVVNVGKFRDEDLLFDALRMERQTGRASAVDKIRGRLRALGYDDEEIDAEMGVGEVARPEVFNFGHQEWQDLDLEDMRVGTEALSTGGMNQFDMEIWELDNGERAFVTAYEPGVQRATDMASDRIRYEIMRRHLPGGEKVALPESKVFEKEDGTTVVAERGMPGEMMQDVDLDHQREMVVQYGDQYLDAFAFQALLGNDDLHIQNVFMDSEGQIAFIDNDKGVKEVTGQDGEFFGLGHTLIRGGFPAYDDLDVYEMHVKHLDPNAFGGNTRSMLAEELRHRMTEIANRLDEDELEEALDAALDAGESAVQHGADVPPREAVSRIRKHFERARNNWPHV